MQNRIIIFRVIICLMILLFASNMAFARFGGGRSFGHFSRSYTHSYHHSSDAKKSGKSRYFRSRSVYGAVGILGVLSLILHGASIYGFVLILLLVAVVSIIYFVNKSKSDMQKRKLPIMQLPDGTDVYKFEEIAYQLFMQLQKLNDQASINSIKNYLTDDLFNQMKAEIFQNSSIAEFKNLQWCYLGFEQNDSDLYASVAFKGLVKEKETNWTYFNETWCFLKSSPNEWLLAGIKQVN
ncbi:hypothetical protein L3V83_11940 [Thiotrichales bacterium 19X7-9]|nr:hypothetical protein [Thiotrichales bacterium 19X7-9]